MSETVAGVTTQYLVDTQNPTGYAQVVDELQNGAVTRTYSFGLERISETQPINSTPTTSFYGYDGHGSVRQLTNSAGAVTDTYDFDAFGNLVNQTGTTPNNYLFAGEQYDPALGLYYNRARYLNTSTGRFINMDPYEGDPQSPHSLHRYLYAGANPVDQADPSGKFGLDDMMASVGAAITVFAMSHPVLIGTVTTVALALNVYLFITDEDFRNGLVSGLGGPAAAGQIFAADIAAAFEFAGSAAEIVYSGWRVGPKIVTLDLFGGTASQIPNAINVDLRATAGVRADVSALPFASESVDKIVASGPRADFIDEAARVLKPGGRIYVNFTPRNPYGHFDDSTLGSLRLKPILVDGPLDPQFSGQSFALTDGTPIDPSKVRTTILEKY